MNKKARASSRACRAVVSSVKRRDYVACVLLAIRPRPRPPGWAARQQQGQRIVTAKLTRPSSDAATRCQALAGSMKSRHTDGDEPQAPVPHEGRTMTERFDETRPSAPIDRRLFIERIAAVAALTGAARGLAAAPLGPGTVPPAGRFNGIQMGPHTILDEGIERTLDLIAETAAINAVMPYSHAYNAALVKPLRDRADHGVPLTDNTGRRFPLVWVRTHDQYYKDTTLRHQVGDREPRARQARSVRRTRRARTQARDEGLRAHPRVVSHEPRRRELRQGGHARRERAVRRTSPAGTIRSTSRSGPARWRTCSAATTSTASSGEPSGWGRS